MAWAEFVNKNGDLTDPKNYIQGPQSNKPDSHQIGEYWLQNHPNWSQVDDGFRPPTIFSALQEQKWNYIKNYRDSEERAPLPYMGKLLDFDTLASERLTWAISAATTAKLVSQSFTIDWTTSDGSVLTMSENDILGIPLAVASRSNLIHQKARDKAQQIANATTAEELEIIVW